MIYQNSYYAGGLYASPYYRIDNSTPEPDPPALTTFVISPHTASGSPGGTLQLSYTAKDQYGDSYVVSPIYTTSNAAAATVNAAGKVTYVDSGTATITASAEALSDSCVVTITVAPDPTPTFGGADGNIILTVRQRRGLR